MTLLQAPWEAMVPLAPRYDPVVLDALVMLDDRGVPMAEVCRRVAAVVEELGLIRPSYVHLRRYLMAYRDELDARALRRAEIRKIVAEAAIDLLGGYVSRHRLDPYAIEERLNRVSRR